MVKRVDRNGEALIWCRTSSGYARQRLGPKFMIRCKAGDIGHERVWQDAETVFIIFEEERGSLPRMREDGKLKSETGG